MAMDTGETGGVAAYVNGNLRRSLTVQPWVTTDWPNMLGPDFLRRAHEPDCDVHIVMEATESFRNCRVVTAVYEHGGMMLAALVGKIPAFKRSDVIRYYPHFRGRPKTAPLPWREVYGEGWARKTSKGLGEELGIKDTRKTNPWKIKAKEFASALHPGHHFLSDDEAEAVLIGRWHEQQLVR